MKQNKVTANFSQNYDTDEKAQARENIGAASTATATQSSDGLMSSQDKIRLDNIQAPVQSDWTVTNTESLAYIQHKPENLVQDANYVHTDNNFTDSEKSKLAGIEDGAEVNVQADWSQSDSTADDYIKNKPAIPDNVYLAEYGVATVAEISAAKNAGKEVFTLIPGTYYSTVAYLREVTRNGANANFASVTSDGASVKIASVDSSGDWTNSTLNLATTSSSSLVQTKYYGDLEPTRVSTLLIDSDDPEGYSQIKADNVTQGHLIAGPYKGLLDSGVPGVGDADTPVYIDSNGTFQSCNALTAGYRISITPGANNTRVIANTMHESLINTCLSWDTLANTYDFDYFWGNWRCHVHLAAFSDWAQDDEAIHIRLSHVYASEAAQKIKCGSYQVQNFYPYQGGNTYEFTNSHWYFDGTDPYTTSTNPDPYGFKFHLNANTPTRQMPTDQKAHRFIVDSGAPYGDWLELDASVRFMVPNAAPSGNGIYLLLKGRYAYSYN